MKLDLSSGWWKKDTNQLIDQMSIESSHNNHILLYVNLIDIRAENSQTKRHLTEFVGVDVEMRCDNLIEVVELVGRIISKAASSTLNHPNLTALLTSNGEFEPLTIPSSLPIFSWEEMNMLLKVIHSDQ